LVTANPGETMAPIKPYTAVGLVPTVRGIRKRADIRVNLEHLKHLVKAAAWLSSLDLPVRLIAIPEGALQGFNDEVLDLDHAQFAREGAIDIPGEETEILGQLAREYDTFIIAQAKAPGHSQCGKMPNRVLQRVLDRMKAGLATDLDLKTLAAESGYSRTHFLRTFRAAMGCSPHRWLTRLRMDQAKTMLRRDSESLIDIALACGFSTHAHFSNTFRQIVGVTPSEYRRSHSPFFCAANISRDPVCRGSATWH
jgi:AraC-like DNA-binding protein